MLSIIEFGAVPDVELSTEGSHSWHTEIGKNLFLKGNVDEAQSHLEAAYRGNMQMDGLSALLRIYLRKGMNGHITRILEDFERSSLRPKLTPPMRADLERHGFAIPLSSPIAALGVAGGAATSF